MEKSGFFDEPDSHRKLALEVEGQKFWVSREVLASYSPVFKAMLYGEFAEAKKDFVPFPDKKAKDMEELLLCLIPHPNVKLIDDSNCKLLLSFADEYQIEDIVIRAEQFLMKKLITCGKAHKDLLDMLTIGSKYRMKEVLAQCIGRCANDFPFSQLKPLFPNLRTEVVAGLAIAAFESPVVCHFSYFESSQEPDCVDRWGPPHTDTVYMKCVLCGRTCCVKCVTFAQCLNVTCEKREPSKYDIGKLLDRM